MQLLRPLALALCLGLTTSPALSQGTCTFRNGSGSNPAGFAWTNTPELGATWDTTVDIATPGADASTVSVFLGGPLAGIPLAYGELLCSPPIQLTDLATGAHSLPIPAWSDLVGIGLSTQAATIRLAPFELQLQNAIDVVIGAPPTADIGVEVHLLVQGSGKPMDPVPGAVVTLRGTDAGSSGGVSGTTDASGRVTFRGVSGPYSVTAQLDVPVGGGTTRFATSLVEVWPDLGGSPATGTIGLFFEDEPKAPPASATLQGQVHNRPPMVGSQALIVGAIARGSHEDDTWTTVDPVTGAYSLPISSGVTIDCYVLHREHPFQPTAPILASLLEPGVGSTTPGGVLAHDFDFANPAVTPWGQPVGLTATGLAGADTPDLQLIAEQPGLGIAFSLPFFEGSVLPTGVLLPDVNHPGLAAYEVTLEADADWSVGSLGLGQDANEVLAVTPPAVALEFLLPPTLTQPAHLSSHTLAEFEALGFELLGSPDGSYAGNGVDMVGLQAEDGVGGPGPAGIAVSTWRIFVRSGTPSFDLPPTALPMFGPSQDLAVHTEQWRMQGFTIDYDAFFDADLASDLPAMFAALTRSAAAYAESLVHLAP